MSDVYLFLTCLVLRVLQDVESYAGQEWPLLDAS